MQCDEVVEDREEVVEDEVLVGFSGFPRRLVT